MNAESPKRLAGLARKAWGFLRLVSGDDAYERYLAHWHHHHRDEGAPMDRAAFHTDELRRRWSGIKRCC